MPEKSKLNRRDFLKGTIAVIGTTIGASLGLPAIPYIIGPALKKSSELEWIKLGPVSKVQVGEPTLFKFKIKTQTGWIVDEHEASAYVLTSDGRTFIALSNICTHLGCRIRWIAEKDQFFCPCHNGQFDKEGKVLGGPPPRPLDRFEIKVENDELYVKGG
jgi:menaquinol-cytochrome c reductase iron-sulfur subunit